MTRLLLICSIGLLVAQGALAAGGERFARCTTSQLRAGLRTAGGNGAARIVVPVRNAGRRCTLVGSIAIVVTQRGRRAAVTGNPLAIPLTGSLAQGKTRVAVAVWTNWCGTRSEVAVEVHFSGTMLHVPFVALPVCRDDARPSRLAPAA